MRMTKELKMAAARERARAWYWANKERKQVYDKKRRKEHPELYRAASKRNRERHPDRKNADTRARRAAIVIRTPPWAEVKAMRQFYRNCPSGMSVDHVIPLRGRRVSGLHVLDNLQYLTLQENIVKHTQHDGKM